MIAVYIIIPLIVLAAVGAIWKARPVHAALLLALTLSLVAVLYLILGADFLGLIQFSVYVGAVAVLIVFSLLITRPSDESKEIARRPKAIVTGLLCSVPVLAVLVYAVSFSNPEEKAVASDAGKLAQLDLAELGETLFTTHAPAVLAVAVMLTAVMIGAALFARDINERES
ncbi:MAG: NADH-quinone oxidoreductase subunit J [Akkermansiaceae bacterium]|tara:strand:- start:2153 stop:2665 length:513 start_codon:yes stop_codon:yes gene_type:complete